MQPVLSCTLHSQPCFPPKDSGHAQKPVDSGVPHAVVLHDFPAGKDMNSKLMEPWDALSKPSFLVVCAYRILTVDIILFINSAFRKGPCTQPCQKAQLKSHPLRRMGSPIQRKNGHGLPVTNFNSVMKLQLKTASFRAQAGMLTCLTCDEVNSNLIKWVFKKIFLMCLTHHLPMRSKYQIFVIILSYPSQPRLLNF